MAPGRRNSRAAGLVCVFLVLAVCLVYWQATGFDFVHFDDEMNIFKNPRVAPGLKAQNLLWFFSHIQFTMYEPVTQFFRCLDCELFGLNPGMHHLTGLLLHAAASVLFFLAFFRLTGALWPSAAVAALFALHPLNVESVAWVSQKNGLLSAVFWALALLAYARYAARPGVTGYLAVFLVFILGLMAKGTLMTLPCVLLLLDYWPLGRVPWDKLASARTVGLIVEKMPFFIASGIFGAINSSHIGTGEQLITLDLVPMSLRLQNILVSYAEYIQKALWPSCLAPFYPFPESLSAAKVALAGAVLAGITALAVWQARKRPYLIVGWLWFLGVLFPASGLFMQGAWPARADRWAYIPLVGVFIMAVWGVDGVLSGSRRKKAALAFLALIILPALMAATWVQARHWKNSGTLFVHTLACTKNNMLIHRKLGDYEFSRGRLAQAEEQYRAALAIEPRYSEALTGLGCVMGEQGRERESLQLFRKALLYRPHYEAANDNLGVALARLGRFEEALPYLQEALRQNPDSFTARTNLGAALMRLGRFDEAAEEFRRMVAVNPQDPVAYKCLGDVELFRGRVPEAVSSYERAVEIRPGFAEAHDNLGVAFFRLQRFSDAAREFSILVSLSPGQAQGYKSLGDALLFQGMLDQAAARYRQALALDPSLPGARQNLNVVLKQMKLS